MLALFKKKMADGASKMNGRTDILEAVCAAAAWVAAADGSIDDSEVEETQKTISSHAVLSKAFQAAEINKVIDEMLKRAANGRTGLASLKKEIGDIAHDTEAAELVLLTALDIADADGNMDEKETAAIGKIGKILGLDPSKYD